MTRIRLSTLFAVVALVSVLLAFRFAVDRDEPYRRLAQLGAKIENHGEDGYCIELPDLIDPEIAIAAIEKIPDVRRIHFVSRLRSGTVHFEFTTSDNYPLDRSAVGPCKLRLS
jgi:hypothetical protein